MKRLSAADIDQEVKERAITAMGQILANLGDCLESKLSQCLPVYVNRLNNEITRLTTVRALTVISRQVNVHVHVMMYMLINIILSFF